ncbi:MAG TPA: pirin family protein [Gammaproteobacteria bacterium]|nr:pirin family protein [Gammaproteobacteria bacterium]
MENIELIIESQTKDLGEFEVRRTLPSKERQRVGPFIFFDHMGPAEFSPGNGVAVRPHPHIGLATLTYLFDGTILHRDNLGHVQPIEPGAVNWMTAGKGIVHSERTPPALLASGSSLHGLQIWLALPLDKEEIDPSFTHYPAKRIPVVEQDGARIQVVAGSAFGVESPVVTTSDTLYLSVNMNGGATVSVPDGIDERAVYVVAGRIRIGSTELSVGTMAILKPGASVELHAIIDAIVVILGGATLEGKRYLYWNLVSSSRERIEQAKDDWRSGRFAKVPGDDEFIPLPD